MLIIKDKQLEVFKNVSFEDFLFRMLESLKINLNISEQDDKLKEEIFAAIKEAENFGFETEDTTEQYLYLKWKYSKFQASPLPKEVLEIITYPNRSPEKIIDELIYHFEQLKIE